MKHKIKTFIIVAAIAVGGIASTSLLVAPSAYAAGDSAKKTSFSFDTCDKDNVGIQCLVNTVLKFLSAAVGIAVVAGVTVGGIKYSTSRGNPAGTQKAVGTITNSIVGLVLYLLMFAIIKFLVPGEVFT